MTEELRTILSALGEAQGVITRYLQPTGKPADRDARQAIGKLIGILDRRDLVVAQRAVKRRPSPARG